MVSTFFSVGEIKFEDGEFVFATPTGRRIFHTASCYLSSLPPPPWWGPKGKILYFYTPKETEKMLTVKKSELLNVGMD